ncbi:DUF2490 domain-containing protein [Myxococcus llanfairpwllgwyngyllgogerychwyrndrobwllllantysiliogogogochensis]|uniref:DUF2490 domain-containing protein n=2 Tax=Myxococcus llanfairpwllgwyngyllgogerychwyrndrobwllllantysiliogogogochensis TaxID=2590453 RepID=A0A540WXA3_9BACT|nr:DUF2490 domain-containing protein [Myxococcus llanfairpwllgwyngyllgogerychwyrndrobwllllantysiliogogogochensis]
MRSQMLRSLLGLMLVIPFRAVEARPVQAEAQLWYTVSAQGGIGEHFLYYLEAQPRFSKDDGRAILRSAGGVRLFQDMSLWLGQGWIPLWVWDGDPALRQGESRLYQQYLYTPKLGSVRGTLRARFEQRFLSGTTEVSLRARVMLRGAQPVAAEGRLSLILWDEVFYHLNSVEGGPSAGFDTNRVFLGVGWKYADHSSVEVGYLNAFIRRPSSEADQLIHALSVSMPFNYL